MAEHNPQRTERALTAPLQKEKVLAYLALMVGLLAIGFSAIFIRRADAPGPVASFYRMSIGLIVLSLPFFRRGKAIGSLPWNELRFALLGGLFFAIDLSFWSSGVVLSGATNPTLLANTAPVWVGLGALILFHERLPAAFWIGLFTAMLGAALILGLDALHSISFGRGTFYGLLAGVFYGGYFLITQRGRKVLDALAYFWVSSLGSVLVLAAINLLFGHPLTGYPQATYLNLIGLGVISQGVGWFLINFAQGHLPATLVAPTLLGQPVVTGLLAGPLLGEWLQPLQIVGGLAVLLGVFWVHHSRSRQR